MVNIKRGDIFWVNLEPVKGSEQGGVRPCLIIQNDDGNFYNPLTIVSPLTSKTFTKEFPTNVFLPRKFCNLEKDSTILLNQIRTIDKKRLIKKICSLDFYFMDKVDLALKISLGID